jgi:hypothetical protein
MSAARERKPDAGENEMNQVLAGLTRASLALSLAVGAAAPMLAPSPVHAQEVEKKVTLNLKDVPLRDAIDALFRGTGLQFTVDPNVPNVPVTLNIRDVGLQQALRIIVRQSAVAVPGLVATHSGDIWEIRIRQAAPPPAADLLDRGPEYPENFDQNLTWEKIQIQFNNVAVFVLAFNGQMLPTEADVLLGGSGGNQGGGFGNQGGSGGNQGGGFGNQGGGFGNQGGGFGNQGGFGQSGFGQSGLGQGFGNGGNRFGQGNGFGSPFGQGAGNGNGNRGPGSGSGIGRF